MLPLKPEPLGTAVAAGAAPARNVMVLPLTVTVSPSAGWAVPTRPVAVAAPLAIRVMPAERAVVPSPAVAVAPVLTPWVAPRVIAEVAACVPPAVPSYSTLLSAVALA
ncbi:hypothetical protein ACVWXM_007139 [Bradyrhizobium sp. GM7.3]